MADTSFLSQAADCAVQAARSAGQILRERVGQRFDLETKGSNIDIVTEVDKQCETVILNTLSSHFPTISVLSEESGEVSALKPPADGDVDDVGSRYRWIVDPLDGTASFAHGHPFFSVSIGLERLNEGSVVGVVYGVMMDEMFVAIKGQGTTCNGKKVSVSPINKLSASMVASGFPYDRRTSDENNLETACAVIKEVQAFRRNGSAALDMAYVACGRAEAYWELKICPWDVAAGVLLVTEAGGRVTDITGKEPFCITDPRVRPVVSNGLIHDELMAIIQQTRSDDA